MEAAEEVSNEIAVQLRDASVHGIKASGITIFTKAAPCPRQSGAGIALSST
jgi:hypothetical protein